jgi:chorismate mutase
MTVSAGRVREIVVDATEEALKQALAREQIAPEKIITVILQPRLYLAIGDYDCFGRR